MSTKELVRESTTTEEVAVEKRHIILWNDSVNTFDWVIECLVKVCEHHPLQAEQCAHITHFKGKCKVLTGDFSYLRPKCEALLDMGLSASID